MNRLKVLLISMPSLFVAPMYALAASSGISNPLDPQFTDLPSFLNGMLDIVIMIAVPIIVLAVVYSGFLFVTAGGKPDQLTSAKKILLWTLVGAAIILGARIIAEGVRATVDEVTAPPGA